MNGFLKYVVLPALKAEMASQNTRARGCGGATRTAGEPLNIEVKIFFINFDNMADRPLLHTKAAVFCLK
jgi:hypothetical protein